MTPTRLTGLALLVALCLATSLAYAAEVTRGPFVQRMLNTSAMIVFDLDDALAAEVRFGPQGQALAQTVTSTAAFRHRITLTGLEPGTRYDYQVWVGGASITETATFKAMPLAGSTFRFLIVGNTQGDAEKHRQVVQRMANETFDFYLHAGNLVAEGDNADQWAEFFDIEKPLLANHAIYPVLGQTDQGESSSGSNFIDAFEIPHDSSGREEYYSFTYANVHVIVIDDIINTQPQWLCPDILFISRCLNPAQSTWLQTEMTTAAANPNIDHILVLSHIGAYSGANGRSGSAEIRGLLFEFRNNKVDVLLSGNDAFYERGQAQNGLPYINTGGGGAALEDPDGELVDELYVHEVALQRKAYHYIVVEVQDTVMKFTVKEVDGTVADYFEVGVRPSCQQDNECSGDAPAPCDGHWECLSNECGWVCDPEQACTVNADCTGEGLSSCTGGHWECATAISECQWICPEERVCSEDNDCSVLSPLTDCQGGAYTCDSQVCVWHCPDDTDGDTDGDTPSDGDETDGDVTDDDDDSTTDDDDDSTTDDDDDAVGDDDDDWSATDGDSATPNGSDADGGGSDGCTQTGLGAWLLLCLLGLLAVSRRRVTVR